MRYDLGISVLYIAIKHGIYDFAINLPINNFKSKQNHDFFVLKEKIFGRYVLFTQLFTKKKKLPGKFQIIGLV